MDITSEQAEKMVEEKMARDAARNAQPEQQNEPDPKPDTPDPETTKPEPEKKPDEPEKGKPEETPEKKDEGTDKPEENPEKKGTDDKPKEKLPPKQRYSHEERIAHKFAKEKQKRKEITDKLNAKIKDLEAKLARTEGLKLEDFDNNTENYVNFRLKERDMQNEVKMAKERIEQEEAEMARQETERRIELSFPDEGEREAYNDLIAKNGPAFYEALQTYDKESVVLNYLNGLDKYPVVLQKLMTDNDALRKVFQNRDPDEMRYQLRQLTTELLSPKKAAPPATDNKQPTPAPAKPALPIVGKQVTANGKPSEPVHDRAYWNNYLREHPIG